MPAEVKVLIEGYTNADLVAEAGKEKNCSTVTLVRDGEIVMIIDPGVMESRQILVDALAKENLTVEDVNVVCISHSHLDHYRNVGMFPNAKVLEYYGLWDKDTIEKWPEDYSENIRILHTPGHDYTGITIFVRTGDGVVAICGDVFWKENYPRDPYDDTFASNPERLKDSRQIILDLADWIVPGHGSIYKNDKEKALAEEKATTEVKKEPKIIVKCKKCGAEMSQKDKCQCRPYICFRCCECGLDCNVCSCSHKK